MSSQEILTAEEANQLKHSVKKYKRNEEDGKTSEEATMEDVEEPRHIWQRSFFVEVVKGFTKKRPIYIGEGEEDPLVGLDMLEVLYHQNEDDGQVDRPVVDIL